MTTAIYPNRIEDKEKVEKELGFSEEGSPDTRFYIGLLHFATGYERIVYGDHGPYIEFTKEQIIAPLKARFGSYIPKLPSENYKYFYLWLCPVEAPDVKVYWQVKPVTYLKNAPDREDGKPSKFNREEGYADYKRGYYYASPYAFNAYNEEKQGIVKLTDDFVDAEAAAISNICDFIRENIDKDFISNIGKPPREKECLKGMIKVKQIIEKEIDHCWQCCPYFESQPMDPMECTHPYFKNKEAYAGCIISWNEDIQNGFPSECPLFKDQK